jgi:hypothetical protein
MPVSGSGVGDLLAVEEPLPERLPALFAEVIHLYIELHELMGGDAFLCSTALAAVLLHCYHPLSITAIGKIPGELKSLFP